MAVSNQEILEVADLVYELCGLVLDETKGYLIEGRLGALLRENNCKDFGELCKKVKANRFGELGDSVVDAITTQETLFFRDQSPYQALANRIVPDIVDAKAKSMFRKRLRIWSAACSTGQEPYSIAMTLADILPDVHTWDITIMATDISDAAIARASRGLFPTHEIQRGLDTRNLNKYFTRCEDGWKANDELRSMIKFQRRNLLKPFTGLGKFDVIFCRNVAIYFDAATKRDLFNRLGQCLEPPGYLFVGSSESLIEMREEFTVQRHCRAVYYQPTSLVTAK